MMQSNINAGLQVVIGLGQSGLSAVQFLVNKGFEVAVTDGTDAPALANKLPEAVTMREFGGINESLLLKASRVVISPGISLQQPAVANAINAGINVVSDIQLFHEALSEWDTPVPIVAITGSNAKSTVTTLVGEMAKNAGINVGVGGNIGIPALNLLYDKKMQLAVLELSSFQLETVTDLNAQVATVLNMSPDHLDRHGDMLGYHQAKHRIFQGAKSVVVNREDELTIPLMRKNVKKISIGSNAPQSSLGNESVEYGLITEADGTTFLARATAGNCEKLLNTAILKIKGQHNYLNALAALALGELVNLPMDSMLNTLKDFAGLAHRCQYIVNKDGIDYFNDSKGTNIGSTMAAIKGLGESYTAVNKSAKLLLILGGQAKGQNFAEVVPLINQFVSQLLFIGEDADLIYGQLKSAGLSHEIVCHQVGSLDKAIEKSKTLTASSLSQVKAVLLSPACASFDQFNSYVERGDKFVKLVHAL
ncbi:MAG: UDP-N-acetylmuramoyl-L-alanine--D-glutamate ligase [Gammaproteobacteria bacterium]|nr:MAG: UDP-N-acetylmuramoyl-L-alanine--D-glutamate ligase [Gammaproteobacteria bacterium]